MGLEQLYQQVILDHQREKHGRGLRDAGELDGPWAQSRQHNPLCGDEVTLRVVLDPGGSAVRDMSWTGDGCAISQASTSVLHDLVTGRSLEQADEVVAAFRAMVRSRGTVTPDEELLGDAAAFAGVGRHTSRVTCAMLAWTAFEDAVATATTTATTTARTTATGTSAAQTSQEDR